MVSIGLTFVRGSKRRFAELPDVRVLLFNPEGAPAAERMARASEVPEMTPGRAVLVALMERYLAGLMDPFVTLLEVHKLMYFMQEAGQPLRLQFRKALYGPYAENLRHVLAAIEGHFVSGYADGGDVPNKPLELVPGVIEDARRMLEQHADAAERFRRVTDLVEGFESPFGMELLATVHWVAKDGAESSDAAVEAVYGWNQRKRQFAPDQIKVAWQVLADKGWIGTPSRGEA